MCNNPELIIAGPPVDRVIMRYLLILLSVIVAGAGYGQEDTLKKWTFGGYAEVYYCYDFSQPANHLRPDFLYNHKRHNEVNANMLLAKANFKDELVRANFGLMAGNYSQYNLRGEPAWAQFIFEANVGLQISRRKNLWLEAGIFPSHIGFESAISADCWTLTRSILAENSPYYESGLKLTYQSPDQTLLLSALYLNGWQTISKSDFIQRPSFGMQATWKPTPEFTFNYSNFAGSALPDSLRSFRHFHNLYFIYEPSDKFGVIAGFDIGFENRNAGAFQNWYAPVIIIKQRIDKRTTVAVRAEYYDDRNEVLINTGRGFQTRGVSSNIDYQVNQRTVIRLEGKMYGAATRIFSENSDVQNFSLTTNIAMKF